jgi:nitroimidazol reductase NimA-like FMN-containing flavoprotein (pyridoxamine 5'-phosphate oxidase superfamily)
VGSAFERTDRTQIRRKPERASYDRDVAHGILDEAIVCHVAFNGADGRPVVIPTLFARIDDTLYVHGSPASSMLRTLAGGVPMCLTVTLVDGLVLAKSAFHHSINYRSVVVFGTATAVTDPEAKARAFDAFVEHVVPGRTADARRPSAKEIKATLLLELPLEEVSVKIRTGPPIDDEEDLGLPAWAGVIDVGAVYAAPTDAPGYAVNYARPSRTS